MTEAGKRRGGRAFARLDQAEREPPRAIGGARDAPGGAAGCIYRLILSKKQQCPDDRVKMLYRSRDTVLSPWLGAVLRLVALPSGGVI
jgi:hypothetical protein